MGRLGRRFGFGTDSTSDFTDNVHLGWWVAGDLLTDEVESRPPFTRQRLLFWHAIGNVATNLSNQGWTTYVATGNMNMNWEFRLAAVASISPTLISRIRPASTSVVT